MINIKDNKGNYLFSKELRDAMAPFADMPANEAIRNPDVLKALMKHAGISDEKMDELLGGEDE